MPQNAQNPVLRVGYIIPLTYQKQSLETVAITGAKIAKILTYQCGHFRLINI